MELNEAIELLKQTVKNAGNVDQNHFDLTLVSVDKRGIYEKALEVSALSIKEGKISREEFLRLVHITS